jgi:putative tryptophan/tyrosine transport system substrate-binding protein
MFGSMDLVAGMKRRDFLGVLAGALAVGPIKARAQASMPVIGILVLGFPDPAGFLSVIREELAKLGYVDGRNCRFEVRSADGSVAKLAGLAAELVRLPVAVLVTWQTPPTIAARDATKDIPIVMAAAGDPVATGIVASLSRPGGNITGNSAIAAEVMSKNVELIREAFPKASRVAVFANTVDPFTQPFLRHIEAAALAVGIGVERVMARPIDDADPYFQLMRDKKVDAAIIQPTLLRPGIAGLAIKHRIPTVSMVSNFPPAGGLMSYGANGPALWRAGALYIDRILKGARPADMPVAQPTRFDLVINLKTAKALGITLPPTIVSRADRVIE